MTSEEILKQRLHNHQLSTNTYTTPEEIVSHLGAVQSQDFTGAKWAIGQRLAQTTDAVLEEAFADGRILRTHVLRPTWHFVTPEDISWMLELTGPHISRAMSSYNKVLELTPEVYNNSEKIIRQLLDENKEVTRQEIKDALEKKQIKTNVQRLAHLVMQAEIDKVVCSGPRRGKQFTYMLFSDRVPSPHKKTRDQALAELTKRYFTSHGPATIKDFVWWSGLTIADAKQGIAYQTTLEKTSIDDNHYYFFPVHAVEIPDQAFLLPNYDEYTVSYKNRDAYFDPAYTSFFDSREGVAFWNMIIFKGKGIASWRKEEKKNHWEVQYKPFIQLSNTLEKHVGIAAKTYATFLGKEILLNGL